jgi:3-oxoacyl-[acyl-carrier protein] reductase
MEAVADVSRRDEFEAAVSATLARFGRWDILVGNAAVATTRPLVEFTEDAIDAMLAVNVKGTVWGMQLAARYLSDGGRIINIGSSTTGLLLPGYAVYDATKAAVEQLTRIGAHELGPRRITVNVVAPGATATESYAAVRGEALVSRFAGMSAFGRLGTPEVIADVVTFVAGPEAGWITGQVLRVNGGTV